MKRGSVVVPRRKRVLKAVRIGGLLPQVLLLLLLSGLLLRMQLLRREVLLQGGTVRKPGGAGACDATHSEVSASM